MSLSPEEKDDLMDVIEIIYGYDSQMSAYKNNFNEQTVEAVEQAIAGLIKCNSDMKTLVVNLLGGAHYTTSGWLKKAIGALKKALDREKIKFNGLACRVVAANNWKSTIIMSTY